MPVCFYLTDDLSDIPGLTVIYPHAITDEMLWDAGVAREIHTINPSIICMTSGDIDDYSTIDGLDIIGPDEGINPNILKYT